MLKKIGQLGFIFVFIFSLFSVGVIAEDSFIRGEEEVVADEEGAVKTIEDEGVSEETVISPAPATDSALDCAGIGGEYDAQYGECLGVDESSCVEIGGKFDSCASACRNQPDADFCTEECVEVCYLSGDNSNIAENPNGTIGIEVENFSDCKKAGGNILEGEVWECELNGNVYVLDKEEGKDWERECDDEDENDVAIWVTGLVVVAIVAFTSGILVGKKK